MARVCGVFTDVRKGENATIGELYSTNRAALLRHLTGNFIGPFAEYCYQMQRISPDSNHEEEMLAIFNNHLSFWLNDFAAALCVESNKSVAGKAGFTEEQYVSLEEFMRKCFILWLENDETQTAYQGQPLAVLTGKDGDVDISDAVRDAIRMASHLLSIYKPEIEAFSGALQECRYRMTPEQIYGWAAKNFTKKNNG